MDDIILTVETGTQQKSVMFIKPSAADTSGNVTLVKHDYNPGDVFPIGSTVVEYVFADDSGNTASCSFIVVVHELLISNDC